MNTWTSRRDFIKTIGLGTAGLSLMALTGGCERLREIIENRPIRRNINTLTATDPVVISYRNAVSAMKALPASDPRSWTAQAQIHLDYCHTAIGSSYPGTDGTCSTSNAYVGSSQAILILPYPIGTGPCAAAFRTSSGVERQILFSIALVSPRQVPWQVPA